MNLSPQKITILVSIILIELLVGLFCTLIPWYYLAAIALFILGSAYFFVKYRAGMYVLILYIIIFGNYVGLELNTQGLSLRNLIPLYAPIYFSLLAAFISNKVAEKKKVFKSWNPLNIPIVILFFYSLFTVIFSVSNYRLIVWFLLTLNLAIYYFILVVVDEETFHRNLMWCWIFAGNILSILVIISIFFKPKITFDFRIFKWLDFVLNYNPHVQIRGYAIGHPNQTSLLLNLTSCIIFGMFFSTEKILKKRFLIASFLLCIFANLLTMSKAGMGSFWAMVHFLILFYGVLRKHLIRNIIIFNLVVICLFILSVLFSQQTSPRLLKVSERGGYETSAGSRLTIWNEGFKALKEHNLTLFGLGVGGFDLYTKFPHAHNLYLSFFFDFGLVGILCILLIMLILFNEFILRELNGILFYQSGYFDNMSVAFIGGLIAIAIHSLVDHAYFKGVLWLFLGFAISTLHHSRLARQGEKGREKSERVSSVMRTAWGDGEYLK